MSGSILLPDTKLKDRINGPKIIETTKNIESLNKYLVNKYEDLSGSVRTYFRIANYQHKKDWLKTNEITDEEFEGLDKKMLTRYYNSLTYNIHNKSRTVRKINSCGHDNPDLPTDTLDIPQKHPATGKYYEVYGSDIDNKQLYSGTPFTDEQANYYTPFYEKIMPKLVDDPGYPNDQTPEPSGDSIPIIKLGLKHAMFQSFDGYNIILFGYGYSGSGKTFTLLTGDPSKEDYGMLLQFLLDIKQKDENESEKYKYEVYIHEIKELYGYLKENLEGDIIDTYSKLKALNFNGLKYGEGINIIEKPSEEIIKYISILIELINHIRIYSGKESELEDEKKRKIDQYGLNVTPKHGKYIIKSTDFETNDKPNIDSTIKPTPNNPESSRSQFFFKLKVIKKARVPGATGGATGGATSVDSGEIGESEKSTEGYLTIIDMAGIENPIELSVNMFPVFDTRVTFRSSADNLDFIKAMPTRNETTTKQLAFRLNTHWGYNRASDAEGVKVIDEEIMTLINKIKVQRTSVENVKNQYSGSESYKKALSDKSPTSRQIKSAWGVYPDYTEIDLSSISEIDDVPGQVRILNSHISNLISDYQHKFDVDIESSYSQVKYQGVSVLSSRNITNSKKIRYAD